jgi:hypothetical protein
VTPLGRSVERATRTCTHSLELCTRAEEVGCALLARHDPYGRTHWDAVRWTHLLNRLAHTHARAQFIRARLEAAHQADALGGDAQ